MFACKVLRPYLYMYLYIGLKVYQDCTFNSACRVSTPSLLVESTDLYGWLSQTYLNYNKFCDNFF